MMFGMARQVYISYYPGKTLQVLVTRWFIHQAYSYAYYYYKGGNP